MEESKKIGVRVVVTQETNDTTHLLFEVFNVREFFVNNDTNKERMKKLKEKASALIKEF